LSTNILPNVYLGEGGWYGVLYRKQVFHTKKITGIIVELSDLDNYILSERRLSTGPLNFFISFKITV